MDQNEFLQQHAPEGAMTPEQAAQFLELAQGDTGTPPESAGAPASATAPEASITEGEQGSTNEQKSATPEAPQEPDPANTVVLAKDGKHTIPYEKLVEARDSAQHWKAQADAAAAELTSLKEQAQQRADAGQAPTKTDNQVAAAEAAIAQGVDPAIFGDFSEGDLAKGIQKLVGEQVTAQVGAQVKAALDSALKPIQQKQQLDASQAHYAAIYEAHPDVDSIAESKELADWIGTQPSFLQDTYRTVLEKGSTAQIVEFFDAFKKATGAVQPPAHTVDPKAAAREAIAKAGEAVPNSLSDIPGGSAGKANPAEALADLSPTDLLERMSSMTPAQIEALL